MRVQVYGWSTSVGAIVTELATVLRSTVALPVREQQSIWDPKDSTDDNTLFILLTPQTVSAYPMYYVAYQTEQWGTHFLDEGSTNWGVPRGRNKTSSYRQVGTAIQKTFRHCGQCATDLLSPAQPRVWSLRYCRVRRAKDLHTDLQSSGRHCLVTLLEPSCHHCSYVEHSAALRRTTLLTDLLLRWLSCPWRSTRLFCSPEP